MSRSLAARCWRPIILTCISCLLPACASDPFARPEVIDLAENRPLLPRSVSVRVVLQGADRYGDRDAWIQELKEVFSRLKVCSAVWGETEDPSRTGDMRVEVLLRDNQAPAEPEVDPQAATLDFFAWSTVPLLPWWIRDVSMDPGIQVQVARTILLPAGQGAESLGNADFSAPPILTNLRERYPLNSWPTLGGIFLPPFAFRSGDREHFCGAAGARVRREVAIRVAREVKESRSRKELLSDLAVEGTSLVCQAGPDLVMLRCRLDGSELEPEEKVLPVAPGGAAASRIELNVGRLLSAAGGGDSLLRIEAFGSDRRVLSYTVRLPTAPGPGARNETN